MTGVDGVLARISELEGRLSTLRAPAPSGFSAALAQAQYAPPAPAAATAATDPGTTRSAAAWAAAQRPAALMTPAPAPASVAGFANGRIPETALVDIGGGDRLQEPAARAFVGMREAAAREGVSLEVNDSYRSLPEQEELAERKGLYSQGGLAARPGTSTHGLGLSVDLHLDGPAQAWMRANAGRFGFSEDVPREPWHWTYAPAVRHLTGADWRSCPPDGLDDPGRTTEPRDECSADGPARETLRTGGPPCRSRSPRSTVRTSR